MPERCDVLVKVVSQKGFCAAGHKVGDEWVIGRSTPQGICGGAFNAMVPDIWVLAFGGSFPWEDDPDVTRTACPDAENPLVFELRRLQGKD